MTDTIAYALMAGDPTTEIWPVWIDNSGNGGGTQSVEVNSDQYDVSDPAEIPYSDDAYVYDVEITGLDPDTEYEITINSEQTVSLTLRTLPEDETEGGTNILFTSDIHTTRDGGMEEIEGKPGAFETMAADEPDIIMLGGDYTVTSYEPSEEKTDDWIEWWADYWQPFRDLDVLPPIFAIPGNHEVWASAGVKPDYNAGYGDEPSDPDTAYYQIFFPNSRDLGPTDENFAQITVGDYLQLIGLDTHSAIAPDQSDWMHDVIDESIPVCIPMHHVAMFPGVDRPASDETIQRHYHDEWAPIFDQYENISFTLCGNEHTRKITKELTVVDNEPDGDHFELDDGTFLTTARSDDDGFRELGDGWMQQQTGTPPLGDWFIDRQSSESDPGEQHYLIHSYDREVTVTEHYADGSTINSHEFNQPQTIVTVGDATLGEITFGGA